MEKLCLKIKWLEDIYGHLVESDIPLEIEDKVIINSCLDKFLQDCDEVGQSPMPDYTMIPVFFEYIRTYGYQIPAIERWRAEDQEGLIWRGFLKKQVHRDA